MTTDALLDQPASLPRLGESRLRAARRKLLAETISVGLPVVGFGLVYGMAAREAGFTLVELEAMNLLVFAGGSQFMAIGLLAAGLPWLTIVLVTAVINSRHLLYGASLAPLLAGRPAIQRALSAYVVVDESYALATAHFQRLGRFDGVGYAMIASVLVATWFASTLAGWATGGAAPAELGPVISVIAPAAITGMAVLLVTSRSTLIAAIVAAAVAIGAAWVIGSAAAIVAGAVLGAFAASVATSRGVPER